MTVYFVVGDNQTNIGELGGEWDLRNNKKAIYGSKNIVEIHSIKARATSNNCLQIKKLKL